MYMSAEVREFVTVEGYISNLLDISEESVSIMKESLISSFIDSGLSVSDGATALSILLVHYGSGTLDSLVDPFSGEVMNGYREPGKKPYNYKKYYEALVDRNRLEYDTVEGTYGGGDLYSRSYSLETIEFLEEDDIEPDITLSSLRRIQHKEYTIDGNPILEPSYDLIAKMNSSNFSYSTFLNMDLSRYRSKYDEVGYEPMDPLLQRDGALLVSCIRALSRVRVVPAWKTDPIIVDGIPPAVIRRYGWFIEFMLEDGHIFLYDKYVGFSRMEVPTSDAIPEGAILFIAPWKKQTSPLYASRGDQFKTTQTSFLHDVSIHGRVIKYVELDPDLVLSPSTILPRWYVFPAKFHRSGLFVTNMEIPQFLVLTKYGYRALYSFWVVNSIIRSYSIMNGEFPTYTQESLKRHSNMVFLYKPMAQVLTKTGILLDNPVSKWVLPYRRIYGSNIVGYHNIKSAYPNNMKVSDSDFLESIVVEYGDEKAFKKGREMCSDPLSMRNLAKLGSPQVVGSLIIRGFLSKIDSMLEEDVPPDMVFITRRAMEKVLHLPSEIKEPSIISRENEVEIPPLLPFSYEDYEPRYQGCIHDLRICRCMKCTSRRVIYDQWLRTDGWIPPPPCDDLMAEVVEIMNSSMFPRPLSLVSSIYAVLSEDIVSIKENRESEARKKLSSITSVRFPMVGGFPSEESYRFISDQELISVSTSSSSEEDNTSSDEEGDCYDQWDQW